VRKKSNTDTSKRVRQICSFDSKRADRRLESTISPFINTVLKQLICDTLKSIQVYVILCLNLETEDRNMKNRLTILKLSALAGGILSACAWYEWCSGLFLLVSFIPFFLIVRTYVPEDGRYGERLMFIRLLPGFALFNILALTWIRIVGLPLLITAVTINTFLMSFTFWLAWLVKRRAGRITGYVSFIVFWLTMEYLTNIVPFLSPWLNLGNGLARETSMIQWYEYTGVGGGTLWILLSNMTAASLISRLIETRSVQTLRQKLPAFILILAIPSVLSMVTGSKTTQSDADPHEILIIQPVIDPYIEKFSSPVENQIDKVLIMAAESVSPNTKLIVAPETTIPTPVNLGKADADKHIASINYFMKQHPGKLLLIGAVTSSSDGNKIHNSALLISSEGTMDYYHKTKLVPGIESSFSGFTSFLQKLFPDLGGTSGGYSGQDYQTILSEKDGSTALAPVICFESVFGGWVSGFIREGAGLIVVITNDGWLKGTLGYYQHLNFCRLRAIENRRPVIRAANTGISAVIDIKGNITHSINWWEEGVLTASVVPENNITFYTRYGDLIMRIAMSISLFVIAIHLIAIPLRKKINLKQISSGMQP
jgi:apolipoprotein N-acyltransferase